MRDKSEKKKTSKPKTAEKKRGDETLDELRESWGDNNKKKDGDAEDSNIFKPEEGSQVIRVLPAADPEDRWFEAYSIHWNQGPDGQDSFRCIEPGGPFGHSKKNDKQRNYRARKCPACKKFCAASQQARKIEFGSKEGKKFWSERVVPWRAKYSYVMAICKPQAKSKAERGKVWIFKPGIMIAKPLIEMHYDKDGIKHTDPKTGCSFKLIKTQLSKKATDVSYEVRMLPTKPLLAWKRLKPKLPDLKTFLPEMLDEGAILAIMNADASEEDTAPPGRKRSTARSERDEDDDADEDEDEDEDEDRPKGRLGARKHRDEDDVDPDEEEAVDEDDENEGAMRAKLAKKAKKVRDLRKKKDDDDDLEDEEEDDDGEED